MNAGRREDWEVARVQPFVRRICVPALALIASLIVPATAAAVQDTTIVRLDSLRVAVTRSTIALDRLPVSAATLSAATIRDGQATAGLDESLDRVPGVFINNRYNFSLGSRISIRGLGARAAFGVRGVRVVSDGIPLTMPDGQSNLNNLELGTAQRIEVLRGPSSALYGNAAGGVISIETEQPPAEFSTEVRATGGDAGRGGLRLDPFYKLQARAGGPVGAGGFVASVSRLETDGYRDFSRAQQTVLNAVSRHPLGGGRLGVVLNLFDGPVAESAGALPRDSVDKDPTLAWPNNVRNGAGEATRQIQAGLSWARPLGDNDRVDVAVYGLSRTVDNALPFAWIDLSRRGGGLRASWSGDRGDGWLALSGGVDVEFMSDDRQEYDNAGGSRGSDLARDQTDRVTSVGPFVQALVGLAPRLDLLAGMRFDVVHFSTADHRIVDGDDSGSRTLSAGSPIFGLSWAASPTTTLYGNVGTAFQTPTTTELINAPPSPGSACCPGGFNVDLEPQRATSVEAGLRTVAGGVVLDLALYRMTVRNTILPFQVADAEGREFFRNAGESLHQGFELSAVRSFGRHSLRAAWTFNDFTFVDDGDDGTAYEDNELPGIPGNHFFAAIQLAPIEPIRVDLELDHTGEYYADDANTAVNDAATVLDLRIHAAMRIGSTAFRPFIAIQNLTSTRYNSSVVVNGFGGRYYEPAPPRNLILGFALGTGGWRHP